MMMILGRLDGLGLGSGGAWTAKSNRDPDFAVGDVIFIIYILRAYSTVCIARVILYSS